MSSTPEPVEGRRRDRQPSAFVLAVRGFLARGCLRASRHVPQRLLAGLARTVAPLALRVPGRARNSLLLNLLVCFPELDEGERLQLARQSLTHALTTMLELGPLWSCDQERLVGMVREVRGEERLEAIRSSGRGVVLLGPHLGSWEMAGLYLSSRYSMTSMYRPPRVSGLEEVYRSARERFGARLVSADAAGVRALYRTLRTGGMVGVLPDQCPGKGAGLFVPFFGAAASTSTLSARLIESTGAVPVLVWAERLAGGDFRLHLRELESMSAAIPDVDRMTRALNRELERVIRQHPQQYLWSYQRFRNQPDGRRNPYRHGIEHILRTPTALPLAPLGESPEARPV